MNENDRNDRNAVTNVLWLGVLVVSVAYTALHYDRSQILVPVFIVTLMNVISRIVRDGLRGAGTLLHRALLHDVSHDDDDGTMK